MFRDQDDTNPFSDPSVQMISTVQIQPHVDNFNPFTDNFNPNEVYKPQPVGAVPTNQDVVRQATEELNRQQDILNSAAENIENREQNLQPQHVIQAVRIKNYPPLPPCCPIKPCFYQDITGEIPVDFRLIVRLHYYFWAAYSFALFVNIAGCLAFWTAAENQFAAGISFAISIGYFVVRMPCSYICWFRPVYNAFRSDSSLNFFLYFIIFLCQIIVLALDSIGIVYYGTAGWIRGFSAFSVKRYGLGAFLITIAILFDLLAIFGFILLTRVNLLYRRSGASFERAKSELNQNIASNQFIRQTTSSAARDAILVTA